MTLMVDRQLRVLVEPVQPADPNQPRIPPLVTVTRPKIGNWNSKIQPASLDLTVGRILLPVDGDSDDRLREETSLPLNQGQTAVVETHEYITMPRTVAAIGFPPSAVSRDGLLMTNPGHIDPGFAGRLQFTVINLGKKPIHLAAGMPICTLLLFSIDAPDRAYDQLFKTDKPPAPSERERLSKLSMDFLNVDQRITRSVNSGIVKAQFGVPVITAFLALVAAIAGNMIVSYASGVSELRVKIEGMEKSAAIQDFKTRLEKLEKKN
jgi:dCTP deaminase